jgi:hypothetical protein
VSVDFLSYVVNNVLTLLCGPSQDGVVVAGSLSDTVFTVEMFTPSQDDNTQQKTVQTIQFETPAYILLLGVMAP